MCVEAIFNSEHFKINNKVPTQCAHYTQYSICSDLSPLHQFVGHSFSRRVLCSSPIYIDSLIVKKVDDFNRHFYINGTFIELDQSM